MKMQMIVLNLNNKLVLIFFAFEFLPRMQLRNFVDVHELLLSAAIAFRIRWGREEAFNDNIFTRSLIHF